MQSLNKWFWGTTDNSTVDEHKLISKTKYKGEKSLKLDLEDLLLKSKTLFHCYQKNYISFLNNKRFWKELQKIKDINNGSENYHDLFLSKLVCRSTPVASKRSLKKYADIIETSFSLAVQFGLCKSHLKTKKQVGGSKEIITHPIQDGDSGELIPGLF